MTVTYTYTSLVFSNHHHTILTINMHFSIFSLFFTCMYSYSLYFSTLQFTKWPTFSNEYLNGNFVIWIKFHWIFVPTDQRQQALHWGQPHEATVVKMAPMRPLASRIFCLLVLLCHHRSLSNLQQRNTEAWYALHQKDRLVSVLVFEQWSPKDSPRDDGRQICPK